MAKVMVVAGGKWQCPIVKKAKDMGHKVLCTNLYDDSPAFEFADYHAVADVLDLNKNFAFAKEYAIDAVLTDQSDVAVPTVAYIAEKLGLNGIGVDAAATFTNKYRMRELCLEHGLPSVHFCKASTLDEADAFLKRFGSAMIKPIDSQASHGVRRVSRVEEAHDAFWEALKYSHAEKSVLLEEVIDGQEFTVDGIMTPSGYVTTAISKKRHFPGNGSVADRLLFSWHDDAFDYSQLAHANEQVVLSFGLPFGLTHAEYIYSNGEYYLIEIAARGGGTLISSTIVPAMSGIDSNEWLVNASLGQYHEIKCNRYEGYIALGFMSFKPGVIRRIEGVESMREMARVLALGMNYEVGDVLPLISDDSTRAGYYIVTGKTLSELEDIERTVRSSISIAYQE